MENRLLNGLSWLEPSSCITSKTLKEILSHGHRLWSGAFRASNLLPAESHGYVYGWVFSIQGYEMPTFCQSMLMTSFPFNFGGASIKSMLMSVQGLVGTSRDTRWSDDLVASYLYCWQITHSLVNFIVFLMPSHPNYTWIRVNILWTPSCPIVGV